MHSLPHHLSAKVASGPGLQCVIWVCIGIGRFRWAPIPQTAPSVPSSLDWSRHLINPLLMTLIIMDLGSIACKQDTDLPFGPFALLSMLPALKGNEASILAALNLPVFVPTLPPPLPSKTPTPKANFKVRTRIRFWSSQVLHPTSRRPQFTPSSHHPGGLTWYLSYPYHHHRLSIPRRSLPHPQIKLDSQGRQQVRLLFCYCESLELTKRWMMEQSRSEFTCRHSNTVEGGRGGLLNLLIENRLLGQRWLEN